MLKPTPPLLAALRIGNRYIMQCLQPLRLMYLDYSHNKHGQDAERGWSDDEVLVSYRKTDGAIGFTPAIDGNIISRNVSIVWTRATLAYLTGATHVYEYDVLDFSGKDAEDTLQGYKSTIDNSGGLTPYEETFKFGRTTTSTSYMQTTMGTSWGRETVSSKAETTRVLEGVVQEEEKELEEIVLLENMQTSSESASVEKEVELTTKEQDRTQRTEDAPPRPLREIKDGAPLGGDDSRSTKGHSTADMSEGKVGVSPRGGGFTVEQERQWRKEAEKYGDDIAKEHVGTAEEKSRVRQAAIAGYIAGAKAEHVGGTSVEVAAAFAGAYAEALGLSAAEQEDVATRAAAAETARLEREQAAEHAEAKEDVTKVKEVTDRVLERKAAMSSDTTTAKESKSSRRKERSHVVITNESEVTGTLEEQIRKRLDKDWVVQTSEEKSEEKVELHTHTTRVPAGKCIRITRTIERKKIDREITRHAVVDFGFEIYMHVDDSRGAFQELFLIPDGRLAKDIRGKSTHAGFKVNKISDFIRMMEGLDLNRPKIKRHLDANDYLDDPYFVAGKIGLEAIAWRSIPLTRGYRINSSREIGVVVEELKGGKDKK